MNRKLYNIEVDPNTSQIGVMAIVVTREENQHFKDTLTSKDYEAPRTNYMIALFKSNKAKQEYLTYHNIVKKLSWSLIPTVFEAHEMFHIKPKGHDEKFRMYEDNYRAYARDLKIPQTIVKEGENVEVINIVANDINRDSTKGVPIKLTLKAYLSLCKLTRTKGVVQQEGKKTIVDEKYSNVTDTTGTIVMEEVLNEPANFLGVVTTIRLMGYGGSGGVQFAPSYRGKFKAYKENDNLIKIVAILESEIIYHKEKEKIPTGKVIYFATDTLMYMS